MANNMIVDEEYIKAEAANIRTGLKRMDRTIDLYVRILNSMSEDAIQDGAAAAVLKAYTGYAGLLKGELESIGTAVDRVLENYLLAVDEADQYLF